MSGRRKRPTRIAVSMGDPAGIGPEVVLGAIAESTDDVEITVYGDGGSIKTAARALGEAGNRGPEIQREFELVAVTTLAAAERKFGKPSKTTGDAAYRYIVAALDAVRKGECDALVTAPISKSWLIEAGHHYPGHTELLAELTGTKKFAMMLVGGKLRVVPVTTHIPLADVPKAIRGDVVFDKLKIVDDGLRNLFGLTNYVIGCAGLNPHAGEDGKVGREEIDIIAPAIERAKAAGINVVGPLPADSAFATRERYAAIVCMYHDQALGPLKALHFDTGVNLTLGLPIIRTSPDHGTAFDVAGKGVAKASSMIAAIELAMKLARARTDKHN